MLRVQRGIQTRKWVRYRVEGSTKKGWINLMGESWEGGKINQVGKTSQKWCNLSNDRYSLNSMFSHLDRRTMRQLFTWKKTIHAFIYLFILMCTIPLVMQSKPILIRNLCTQHKSVWRFTIYVFNSLGLKLKVHYAFFLFFCFCKWNLVLFFSPDLFVHRWCSIWSIIQDWAGKVVRVENDNIHSGLSVFRMSILTKY